LAKGKVKVMAKKRLNKKIMFLGSVFLILFLLVAIGGILYLTQGPEQFIEDGDAAQKAADEASDPNTKEEKYKEAIRNYGRARARAKSDELKVEMLFKLVDVFLKTDEWRSVLGCWNRIVQIDSTNIKARYGRLKYLYIIAEGGGRRVWNEISSQASELIEVVENKKLLDDERNKWESFDIKEKRTGSQFMGAFLYFAKGRALLEIADMGGVTDIDETFEQAIESLKRFWSLNRIMLMRIGIYRNLFIRKGRFLLREVRLKQRKKPQRRQWNC
jgi:hypothetical protein